MCARGSHGRYSEVKGSYKWFVFLATWGLSLTGRSLMHTKCTHMLTDNLNCVMWERHFATLNADLRPGVPCGTNTFLIPSFHPRQRERERETAGGIRRKEDGQERRGERGGKHERKREQNPRVEGEKRLRIALSAALKLPALPLSKTSQRETALSLEERERHRESTRKKPFLSPKERF